MLMAFQASAFTPESGHYWDPEEPGSGYTFEIQDNYFFSTFYVYEDGYPVWFTSEGFLDGNSSFTGHLMYFTGGQCLGCYWQQNSGEDAGYGNVNIEFITETTAELTILGVTKTVERFNMYLGDELQKMRGEWQVVIDASQFTDTNTYPYFSDVMLFEQVEVFEGDGTTLGVQWANEKGGGTQFTNGVVGIGSLAVGVNQAEDKTIVDTITTTSNGDTVVVPTEKTQLGDLSTLGALLGGVNGFLLGGVKDGWGAVLQAVSTDTNSNILATPHLTTMDNEEAFFIVGQEVPIITGSTTGSSNSNPFTSVERQEVGIKLKVTPQINEGDAVQLLIEQEVSSVSGATSVDILINKREIKTSVIVDDGGTIVLGGLIDEDVQESVSKVPLLGDIPLIGHLFKSTSTSVRKRNLMVFIRPTIIRDGVTMNEISQKKYQYIRAEQLKRQSQGIPLMPFSEGPSLPEWDESLSLPPSFEDYIEKEKKEGND